MPKGKIRSVAHIIDGQAISLVKRMLPAEWVVRELAPDYGIDLDIELFDKEDGQLVTLGEHIYFQVKGTENARYQDVATRTCDGSVTEKHLAFSLDTALLQLVERIGNSISILLVTVDINTSQAYYVCLNDYIDYVLCDEPQWRNQATKTIYVPCHNTFDKVQLLRWYGIRAKLLGFFCDAKAVESKMMYWCEIEKYLAVSSDYVHRISASDVWHTIDLGFGFLYPSHELVKQILDNGIVDSAANMFAHDDKDARYESGYYSNLTAYEAKQLASYRRLFESIDTANLMFHDDLRRFFVPSKYDAQMKIWTASEQ